MCNYSHCLEPDSFNPIDIDGLQLLFWRIWWATRSRQVPPRHGVPGPNEFPILGRCPVPGSAVKIGGIAATVKFAGLVSPGEYQFNVVVPATTPDGNRTIAATLNGIATQGNAQIAVQH
jgi:hypothetical protein